MKKKGIILFFIAFALFLFLMGVYWLAFAVCLLGLVLYVFKRLKLSEKLQRHSWVKTASTLAGVFLFAILVRVFMLEIFSIPSGSMEDTLIPGDKVLVNKLVYGPELPRSPFEIPWINLLFYMNKQARASMDSLWWDYHRLSGFSDVDRGDVLVFRHPLGGGRDNYFIKRCVALPGDTLAVENNRVKINGKFSPESENVKTRYRVWPHDVKQFRHFADSLNLRAIGGFRGNTEGNFVEFILTNRQKKQLTEQHLTDSLLVCRLPKDSVNWVYPQHPEFFWTVNDYGPLIIPYNGMQLELTRSNYLIYERTIRQVEHQRLEEKDGAFYLNGQLASQYAFKNDYYFMMGDNRDDSNDSRHWGFVPEENIVGNAKLVLFSNDWDGFKWNRLFRMIR